MAELQNNPYKNLLKSLDVNGKQFQYFSLPDLKDARLGKYYIRCTVNCPYIVISFNAN